MRRITELDNQYQGETMWVIGRGPSLEWLRSEHIGAGPVIAINQAIRIVEDLGLPNPLYSMQKDQFFFPPRFAAILAHEQESVRRARLDLEKATTYIFDNPGDFGIEWNMPSVVSCAGLAYRMGCAKVIYLCCDASTHGDTGAFGQPPTEPQGYLFHRPMVARYTRLPVEWQRIERIDG